MSTTDCPSIAGGWLGTYHYRGSQERQPPCRFEATFSSHGDAGHFNGTIMDDGPLGAATASGMQKGLRVRFTKVYPLSVAARSILAPVEYEGTFAEDGRTMSGTWEIRIPNPTAPRPLRTHGVWEAHRLWEEAEETESVRREESAALVAVART